MDGLSWRGSSCLCRPRYTPLNKHASDDSAPTLHVARQGSRRRPYAVRRPRAAPSAVCGPPCVLCGPPSAIRLSAVRLMRSAVGHSAVRRASYAVRSRPFGCPPCVLCGPHKHTHARVRARLSLSLSLPLSPSLSFSPVPLTSCPAEDGTGAAAASHDAACPTNVEASDPGKTPPPPSPPTIIRSLPQFD